MRKLVEVDSVRVILTNYTNVVTAQIPLADELKVPTLSNIEAPGLFSKSKYSFSHAPTWGINLPLIGTYWRAHRIKRVYGLLTNSAPGLQKSAALRALVAEIGGEYGEGLLDLAATDYRGVVARAKEMSPDVLVTDGQGSTAEALVIRQAREMGVTTPVWTLSAAYQGKAFRDLLGPYGEGMIMAGIVLDPNDPASNPFARAFRAQLGYIPGYPVGELYDDVTILAYVIGKVGYDADAIAAALATLKGVPSVLGGTITMGPDHYTRFSRLGLWKVKAGKLVRLT